MNKVVNVHLGAEHRRCLELVAEDWLRLAFRVLPADELLAMSEDAKRAFLPMVLRASILGDVLKRLRRSQAYVGARTPLKFRMYEAREACELLIREHARLERDGKYLAERSRRGDVVALPLLHTVFLLYRAGWPAMGRRPRRLDPGVVAEARRGARHGWASEQIYARFRARGMTRSAARRIKKEPSTE